MNVTHDGKLLIAIGRSRTAKQWQNKEMLWSAFLDKLAATTRTRETVAEYAALSKADKDNIKDVGGFVGGYLKNGRRNNASVVNRCLVCLDVDHADPELFSDLDVSFINAYALYSTHSHTPAHMRLRLIIPLSRAVTRKTLCAAVARVLKPGIKFDSMLVLNGPQGVGKSTLIARLGGEWFNDSLSLSDTRDKTAAEKMQGYWIMEIGELAGLRKAEVETLRSFLSRQNDIYRASFGKRATPHLRQCVFFGTTNEESGYLRDTTGNRRFWPVRTPGNGCKHSWQLTQEEVGQIWAEAYAYVRQGERIHLDPEMERLAKEEQREAMEADEREGLVREYLDKLLPEKWPEMELAERRGFLRGDPFTGGDQVGTVRRMTVCALEVWCECFGKDSGSIRRSDTNDIFSMLTRIGWKRTKANTAGTRRISLYGMQRCFDRPEVEQD